MGNDKDFDRIGKVTAFVNDRKRFEAVVATVNRRLRFNRDGSESAFGRMERAETAEDIVCGLVADALCGGPRKWDVNEMPSFEGWILSQIRSMKFNLVRKNRRVAEKVSQSNDADSESDAAVRDGAPLAQVSGPGTPEPDCQEEALADFEIDEFIRVLTKRLKNRPVDSSVFEGIRDGKPDGEIASALNIDIGEVRNAKKRIKRVIDKLLREHN